MKKTFFLVSAVSVTAFLFAFISLSPVFSVLFPIKIALAQDSSETITDSTPTQQQITVNLNVRYQSSVVWSGQTTLNKGSLINVTDDNGSSHSIASDSALSALVSADNSSADFSLSDLSYYQSLGSFYVNCIDINSLSKHACQNWQYVVNGSYPPEGADKYILNDGDTIYFYFGNQHRVTLSSATIAQSVPFTVKAETYDYTNDSWRAFSGTTVGATQPNPNDQYNPTVITTAVTDQNGNANLTLTNSGSYGIGIAADYYSPVETLTVTSSTPATVKSSVSTGNTTNSVSPLGSGSSRSSSSATSNIAGVAAVQEPLKIAEDAGKTLIRLDVSILRFIQRYLEIIGTIIH